MGIDLTGGLSEAREYGFDTFPDTPDMRDSVNFWLCDDQGRFGMPRCTMEAIGPDWENSRQAMVNIAFPDGRVFSRRDYKCSAPLDNRGPDGRPTVFRAGPIAFELVEPFVRWSASFSGDCAAVTSREQMEGLHGGEGEQRVPVSWEVEMTSAVPPWVPTSHLEPGLRAILTEEELVYTHEWGPCHRQEQLFRCRGTLRIGDEERYDFTGTGLRIRRQNIFRTSTFTGHVWQSALFPGGKAFGCNTYAPRLDGKPSYSEGWIFDGETVLPARVVRVPWLTELRESGDDVSVILETERGYHHIGGETFASTFEPNVSMGIEAFAPYLHQASVRYVWDGEETYGMMERSTLRHKLFPGQANPHG